MSRRQKKERAARESLKKGDRVMTNAGLVGELVEMDDAPREGEDRAGRHRADRREHGHAVRRPGGEGGRQGIEGSQGCFRQEVTLASAHAPPNDCDSDMPNKNVLAILSGVVALGLAALAVAMHGEPLPVLGATAAAVGLFSWGVTNPARRTAARAHGDRRRLRRRSSSTSTTSGASSSCGLVFVWSALRPAARHGRRLAAQGGLRRRRVPGARASPCGRRRTT